MFPTEIRPEGQTIKSEEQKKKQREYMARLRAEKKAVRLATGEQTPKPTGFAAGHGTPNKSGTQKSVVNRVTEYGALFNRLNDAHMAKGLPPLKTAMEVLIEAMQSDELDLKEKSKIAEKLATFESSRAPIISIEHVQNINSENDANADDALQEFIQSLRKV